MSAIGRIFILHGKGGSPEGSSKRLQTCLEQQEPGLEGLFTRPRLLHSDPTVLAEDSLADLSRMNIPDTSLLIGISLGGLLAAKLQEDQRSDLHVICISSPTWADAVRLQQMMPRRTALYSSADEVIQGRTDDWPQLADAYDLPWLSHDTDRHAEALARLILRQLHEKEMLRFDNSS